MVILFVLGLLPRVALAAAFYAEDCRGAPEHEQDCAHAVESHHPDSHPGISHCLECLAVSLLDCSVSTPTHPESYRFDAEAGTLDDIAFEVAPPATSIAPDSVRHPVFWHQVAKINTSSSVPAYLLTQRLRI